MKEHGLNDSKLIEAAAKHLDVDLDEAISTVIPADPVQVLVMEFDADADSYLLHSCEDPSPACKLPETATIQIPKDHVRAVSPMFTAASLNETQREMSEETDALSFRGTAEQFGISQPAEPLGDHDLPECEECGNPVAEENAAAGPAGHAVHESCAGEAGDQ